MSRSNCAIGKDYKPASYKGVAFMCSTVDYFGGRRVAEAEYPFANHTNAEDMGIKLKYFNVTAVFREDDHVGDARALFAACESPGPGLLVHPTYGAVTVICRACKIKDDVETDQGQSSAEMEFLEFNAIGAFGALASLFGVAANALHTASRNTFLATYRPIVVSEPWRTDVINRAQQMVDVAATEYSRLLGPDALPSHWRELMKIQVVVSDDVKAADAHVVDYALSTASMGITVLTEDVEKRAKSYRKMANAAAGSSRLPIGAAQESEEAVLSRTRVLSAVGMAEAAMATTYDHVEQALRAHDAVIAVLEDEAKAAYTVCNNALFLELRRYAINVSKMLYDRAYRLPPTLAVDFSGSVYPLKAAYVIYNDAKRHRELEKRNVLITADGRFDSVVTAVAATPSPGVQ